MPFFDDIDAIDERIDAKSSPPFINGVVISVQPRYVRIRSAGSSRSVNAYYNGSAPPNVGDKCMAALSPQENKYVLVTAYQGQGSRSGIGNRQSEDFALAPPSNLAANPIPEGIVVKWDDPVAQSVAFELQTNDSGVDLGATTYIVTRSGLVIPSTEILYVRVRSISKDFRYSSWSDWVSATPTFMPTSLDEMLDIDFTIAPIGGDVLTYHGGDNKWKAESIPNQSLSQLADVDLSPPATDGQALIYDDASGKWIPGAAVGGASAIADLTDVDLTPPQTDGQVLIWNSSTSKWEPGDMSGGGGGAGELDDLTDVDLTTPPTDGQILIFDSADSQFKPGDLPAEFVPVDTDLVYRKRIARTVLGSDTAQFDFDLTALGAVATEYDRLIIRAGLRSSVAATSDLFRIFFNADYTVGNYRQAYQYGGNSTSGSGSSTPDISWADGSTANSGSFGEMQLEIENPFSSTTVKKAQGIVTNLRTSSESYAVSFSVIKPGSTAALTQITLRLDGYATDVFKTGSWVEIIGEKSGTIPVTLVTTTAMDDLTDVNTTGVADGDVLLYDAGTSTYLPGEMPGNYVTKKVMRTYELIEEYTVSTPATTSKVFTLPQTFDEIYIEFEGKSDGATTHSRMKAIINGDTTGTNYWFQYLYGSSSATIQQANDRFVGGYISAATATNYNIPSRLGMLFELYASGTYHKRVSGSMGRHYGTNYEAVGAFGTIWRNTAPITTVQFDIESGYNFVVGCKFKVWGVKNREVVVDGRAPDTNPTPPKKVVTFEIAGIQALVARPTRIYNAWSQDFTIDRVHIAVDTPPTGANLIVDVNKNGTTIFTTQANRPEIAAGAYTAQTTTINVTAFNQGDYLQIDVDQIGSTIAGANLVVQIVMS